jgi:hypothetical protein
MDARSLTRGHFPSCYQLDGIAGEAASARPSSSSGWYELEPSGPVLPSPGIGSGRPEALLL